MVHPETSWGLWGSLERTQRNAGVGGFWGREDSGGISAGVAA